MIERRPPGNAKLAAALNLPPDTSDAVIASRARRRRAINLIYEINKEYTANTTPVRAAPKKEPKIPKE